MTHSRRTESSVTDADRVDGLNEAHLSLRKKMEVTAGA
jgi:hypothetical protein